MSNVLANRRHEGLGFLYWGVVERALISPHQAVDEDLEHRQAERELGLDQAPTNSLLERVVSGGIAGCPVGPDASPPSEAAGNADLPKPVKIIDPAPSRHPEVACSPGCTGETPWEPQWNGWAD
ncbi:MAG: hypothetical protein M3Y56_13510 [Armatimonadota bacterium]|nr:hypothetical protein [Armatimonadota bacterium]